MAEFFTIYRKWVALAILIAGAAAGWWSSHDGPTEADARPAGQPLAWQEAPLAPAVAQPPWAVPTAIVGQTPAPAVAAPYEPHNPLEAPFPTDDGSRPPALGANFPATSPPPPGPVYRPEATRRARLNDVEPTAGDAALPRIHRVVDGDTLASLAERYWGARDLADALFAVNRDRLRTADVLPIGLELQIPAAPSQALPAPAAEHARPENLTDVRAPAPWAPATPSAAMPVSAWPAMSSVSPGALQREIPSQTALGVPTQFAAPLPPDSQPVATPPSLTPVAQAPVPQAPPAAITPSGLRTHVVRRGDTLSSIARLYYGDPNRWGDLYAANRAVVPNPNRLAVGAELTVP